MMMFSILAPGKPLSLLLTHFSLTFLSEIVSICGVQECNVVYKCTMIAYLILKHNMHLSFSYLWRDWLLAFSCQSVENSRSHRKPSAGGSVCV